MLRNLLITDYFALKHISTIFNLNHLKKIFQDSCSQTYTCIICAFYIYISFKRMKSFVLFFLHMIVQILEKLHCLLAGTLYLCSFTQVLLSHLRWLDGCGHFQTILIFFRRTFYKEIWTWILKLIIWNFSLLNNC